MPAKFGFPTQEVSKIVQPRSWAIYGRSGAGKTTFCGTFPTPMLYLNIRDKGTDSIADIKGIQVADVIEWDDFEDIHLALRKDPKAFKTIVFDTVTQMQGMAQEHVLTRKKKSTASLGDWGTMTMREWADVSAMMKEKITIFRDLPAEVVFIAQERVRNNKDDEGEESVLTPEVGPALSPAIASHLNASVSIIGNMFVEMKHKTIKDEKKKKSIDRVEFRHKLRLSPHAIYLTKVRKSKTIDVGDIEDPTYQDVVDVLMGK
jgi:hypothetical protein